LARVLRIAAAALSIGTAYAIFLLAGCTPSADLGGIEVINAVPDTYITGSPPNLRDTDFFVEFHWTGSDPDGRVEGYQWKISSNSSDGISVADTLTFDPATGDTLNPWHYTTSTDSVFFVEADSSNFIDDYDLPEDLQRFYQPHTMFIRAVDDKGAVDPTPAMITFTSTTLAPTVSMTAPPSFVGVATDSRPVPPSFQVQWAGSDPDFIELGVPTKIRYMLKDALFVNAFGQEQYLTTRTEYRIFGDTLITFSDPNWSDWVPYALDPEDRIETFTVNKTDDLGRLKHYFFAIQAQDTAGAVSLDRDYGSTVKNFFVNDTTSPLLRVRERYLGTSQGEGLYGRTEVDIAQNQPLLFDWSASASSYGGVIAGYRYGWDVEDLDDDNDEGWVTQFGLTESNTQSELKVWNSGIHALTVECLDNSGFKSRYTYLLNVVPVPDPADQLPLLLIDDVYDDLSNGWQNEDGTIQYSNDVYRDAFWDYVLTQGASVSGFNQANDVIDNEGQGGIWGYRDVVSYKNLIWTSNFHVNTYIAQNFQGRFITQTDGSVVPIEAYVWLDTYQANVGNILLTGSGVIRNFHHTNYAQIAWLDPVIYTADETSFDCPGAGQRGMSFGTYEEDDGSLTILGVLQYPHRGMGLTVSSILLPASFYNTPTTCGSGIRDIKIRCVGTKAIILNPEFRDQHVGSGAFEDTIFVFDEIDFVDHQGGIPDPADPYIFGAYDEYYDTNRTARPTSWYPQVLEDGSLVIEPMWHVYTRWDYILDQHLSHGESDYPDFDPADICGPLSVSEATMRTINDGVPIGVFSYLASQTKPSGLADVLWGFDPNMFERARMKDAVLWVLGEHFGLTVTP